MSDVSDEERRDKAQEAETVGHRHPENDTDESGAYETPLGPGADGPEEPVGRDLPDAGTQAPPLAGVSSDDAKAAAGEKTDDSDSAVQVADPAEEETPD